MKHITRRAVRIAVGSAAVVAALALPLTLGASSAAAAAAAAAHGTPAPVVVDENGDIQGGPKPEKPIEETGSWVWDKVAP